MTNGCVKDLIRTVKFVNLENKIQPKMPAKLRTCHVGIVSIPNPARNPYSSRFWDWPRKVQKMAQKKYRIGHRVTVFMYLNEEFDVSNRHFEVRTVGKIEMQSQLHCNTNYQAHTLCQLGIYTLHIYTPAAYHGEYSKRGVDRGYPGPSLRSFPPLIAFNPRKLLSMKINKLHKMHAKNHGFHSVYG